MAAREHLEGGGEDAGGGGVAAGRAYGQPMEGEVLDSASAFMVVQVLCRIVQKLANKEDSTDAPTPRELRPSTGAPPLPRRRASSTPSSRALQRPCAAPTPRELCGRAAGSSGRVGKRARKESQDGPRAGGGSRDALEEDVDAAAPACPRSSRHYSFNRCFFHVYLAQLYACWFNVSTFKKIHGELCKLLEVFLFQFTGFGEFKRLIRHQPLFRTEVEQGHSSEFMASRRGGGKAAVIAAESSLAILSVHVQQQLLLQTMTLSDLHLKENLPGDPSYQNIKKIFSAVGRIIKKQHDGYDSEEAEFSLMLFSNEYSEIMEQIDRDVKCTTLTCISSVQMPIAVSSTKLAWRERRARGSTKLCKPSNANRVPCNSNKNTDSKTSLEALGSESQDMAL
ncbi:unnamed protein product [Miscanthus lutarioriparius]|uniref:Uncharacterized protein n=1 Tax=Miscanthus lutarioriparius TaxID=422564 RepID=A0A811NHZ1_9POAL|nr:unnamed protein product [Miscanthus lutarioriparius]